MKKTIIIFITIFTTICLVATNLTVFAEDDDTEQTSVTINPNVKKYEKSANNDNLNTSYSIDTELEGNFSYYEESRGEVGRLQVTGDISSSDNVYDGVQAIGTSNNLSFSYEYDDTYYKGSKDTQWTIKTESNNKIVDSTQLDENGKATTITSSGSFKRGSILIQKKSNIDDHYTTIDPIVVNYIENYNEDDRVNYTTAGEDINAGTFYRYIFVYTMGKKIDTGWWGSPIYTYYKCVEVYEFYVVNDTGLISIHNNSVDTDTFEEVDGLTTEQLIKGETLKDGSVTIAGFTIDKLGIDNTVYVKKDDDDMEEVEDQTSFAENGKYLITVKTKLNLEINYTIYIFDGGKDFGFSTYFEDFIVSGRRLLANTPYPAYEKNSQIFIKELDKSIPFLNGTLENKRTEEVISITQTEDGFSYGLDVGEYECILYNNCEEEVGSYYEYVFNFFIIDDKSEPSVNYETLFTRTMFQDLQSKHYEVAYQTTKGGYIFVCFSLDSYNDATSYAYEIEKRFIEKVDGTIYYKSIENPNKKIIYYHDEDLMNALYYYAEKNVEFAYFNPADEFTSRTYDNDLLERLDELNLEKSIRVFPNQNELDKMSKPTEGNIKRPFINDYTFVQVADFDVAKVEAYCQRNGKTYNLEFDVPVKSQLNVSSVYTITETNVYGVTRTYDVIFTMENNSAVNFEYEIDGQTINKEITSFDMFNGSYKLTADKFHFISSFNNLDDSSIVTIKAPNVYSFEIKCLLSEITNVILYKAGFYEINFIDRNNNKMSIELTLTGESRYDGNSNKSYTSLYNSIYLAKQQLNEENYISDVALARLINHKFDESIFPNEAYKAEYTSLIEEAKLIYFNFNSSQNEINNIVSKIETFITAMEGFDYLSELYSMLSYVERVNPNIYSVDSILKINELYEVINNALTSSTLNHDHIKSLMSQLDEALQNLSLSSDALKVLLQTIIDLDCSIYTQGSLEKVNNLYVLGLEIYNDKNASKEDMDKVILDIIIALEELILLGDMNSLNDLLNTILNLDFSKYATSSISNLNNLFESANTMYIEQNSSVFEVELMIEKLQDAIDSLELSVDISELLSLLQAVENIDYYLYTQVTINDLKAIYDKAYEQAQTNLSFAENLIIENQLKSALNKLVESEGKVLLNSKLESYEIPKKAKAESVKKFEELYKEAYERLYDLEDITEEEANEIINNLKVAFNQIEVSKGIPLFVIIIIIIVAVIGVLAIIGSLA